VDSLFTKILRRTADRSFLDVALDALGRGASLEEIAAALLASDEYVTKAGNRVDSWLGSATDIATSPS
jgi:hypothetical protein